MQTNRPVIIDGNNLAARSIMAVALDDLKAGGTWTGGIYGTLNSLSSILARFDREDCAPTSVHAFFDQGVHPIRKKLCPEYKENRKKSREQLSDEDREKAFQQMDTIRDDMLPVLGVQSLRYKDREADDAVVAAVRSWKEHDPTCEPIVISGDKDLFQSIRYGARVWYLSGSRWVTRETWAEDIMDVFKIGTAVPLEAYVTFRALIGDASDGIAGVKGCGPARAAELIVDTAAKQEAAAAGVWSFYDESPCGQLRLILYWLGRETNDEPAEVVAKRRAKFPAFKSAVLTELTTTPRLAHVAMAIDLSTSFGSCGKDSKLMARMLTPQTFDKMTALRFFKKLGFKSVIGDPSRYLGPFERLSA